jgi:antitoxin component YwqK of YwqJK toxin-antitoxin module
MIKKYRLINIGEKKDITLNSMILWVELAPIKINDLLNEYTFFESEKESFIFLLDQNQVDYFLKNPEEIKEVNLDNFEIGNTITADGENVKSYKHQDYLKKFRSIKSLIKVNPGRGEMNEELKEEVIINKEDVKFVDGVLYLKHDMSLVTGIVKECYKSGELASEGEFKDGKSDGVTKGYYKNGQLKYTINVKDGKRDGAGKGWHENGKLKYIQNWKCGIEDGVTKVWHQNGQASFEKTFENGEVISLVYLD